VLIVRTGPAILMLYDWEALLDFWSVAVIMNGNVPALVGVPLIVPLVLTSERPGGSVPLLEKRQLPEHPLAFNVAEYALPTIPFGRLAGLILMSAFALSIDQASNAAKKIQPHKRTQLQCSILPVTVQVSKLTAPDFGSSIAQPAIASVRKLTMGPPESTGVQRSGMGRKASTGRNTAFLELPPSGPVPGQ